MKKIFKGTFIFIFIAFSTFKVWEYFHDKNFVKENLTTYTNITNFVVKREYFDDYQSYIEVTISKEDRQKLLSKYKFEKTFVSKLRGEVQCKFISENEDYLYYLDLDGYGPYGYILYAIQKNGNTLKLYEMYGN